jgi:hypothetical protein
MNSSCSRIFVFVLAVLFSSVASAEVSDKFASIPELLLQGLGASMIGFFLARWHAWLAVVGIGLGIVMFSGMSLLWYDEDMGKALVAEQGVKYFLARGFSGLAVDASSVVGAVIYRRRNRTQITDGS